MIGLYIGRGHLTESLRRIVSLSDLKHLAAMKLSNENC